MRKRYIKALGIIMLGVCFIAGCKQHPVINSGRVETFMDSTLLSFDIQDVMKQNINNMVVDIDNKSNRWNDEIEAVSEEYWYWDTSSVYQEPMPIHFEPEDVDLYCDNLFLTVTVFPDLLDKCYNRLSEESIEMIQEFEWPDSIVCQQFDWAETKMTEVKEGAYICGTTLIKTCYGELADREYFEVEYVWKIADKQESLIEVQEIHLIFPEGEKQVVSLKQAIPKMSAKELTSYTGKLYLLLTREPFRIEEYRDVFTSESIQKWKEIEWYYANPKEVYDDSGSSADIYQQPYDIVNGYTVVSSHYPMGVVDFSQFSVNPNMKYNTEVQDYVDAFWPEKDRDSEPMFDWLIQIDWVYKWDTGKIEIKDICIYPNI